MYNSQHAPKDLSLSVKPSGGERFSDLNVFLTDTTQAAQALSSAETLVPLDPARSPPTLSQTTELALTKLSHSTFESLIPTLGSLEQRKQFLCKIQKILDLEFPKVEIKAQLFGFVSFFAFLMKDPPSTDSEQLRVM